MAHYKPDSKNFAALQGSVVVITGMYSTASVWYRKTALTIRQEHRQA
jgi:hypothetical protein